MKRSVVRSAAVGLLLGACAGGAPSDPASRPAPSPRDFIAVDGALVAHNVDRDLTASLRDHASAIGIATTTGALTLETTSLGCAAIELGLDSRRSIGPRVELLRADVVEWYENREGGVEQGFTFHERPDCPVGSLTIELRAGGELHATLEEDGTRVVFSNANGARELAYGALSANDATGASVPAHLALDGEHVRIVIDDHAATYPLVVDPLITNEQVRLSASDAAAGADFGLAVAVSGDTMVVGAPEASSNAGTVYVFLRTGTTWAQQQRIALTGSSHFGSAVAIDGDTLVVGTPYPRSFSGDAFVYVRTGTTWAPQGGTLNTGSMTSAFGTSVAIDRDTIVVGALGSGSLGEAGSAYVYVRTAGTWTRTDTLGPQSDMGPGMNFGASVAIDGARIVVGAPFTNVAGVRMGAAYAFGYGSCFPAWEQEAEVLAPDGAATGEFGNAVAVSGDTILVGAHRTNFVTRQGHAYFFTRLDAGTNPCLTSPFSWPLQQEVNGSDSVDNDQFGTSVAIVGDRAVIGAANAAIGGVAFAGTGYYFTRTGTVWTERTKLVATDSGQLGDGAAAAIGDTFVALGANAAPQGTTLRTGGVYVFDTSHAGNGATCVAAGDCASGFCVDGVCCNNACGGNSTSDCQACSIAAGAVADGSCHSVAVGTSCNDGSMCTSGDTCSAVGACGGTASPCVPVDACHTAACDPVTGACTQTALPAGSSCDDGNGCTTGETCQAGLCSGGGPRVCSAIDACHIAGTCDVTSGTCSNPPVADGVVCDDGNACTRTDTCQVGTCTGGNPVACTASDPCHSVGVCDPTAGLCSNPPVADGTGCDDADGCTTSDTCVAGACAGAPMVCGAGPCQTAGVCTAGACPAPIPLADGTACPSGMCSAGNCVFPDGGAMPDAGIPDAATPVDAASDGDAGAMNDAAMTADAGIDASAAHDAGRDASARDGSATFDANITSPMVTNGGCGCAVPTTSRSSAGGWLALALASIMIGRRRRRR